MICTFLFYHTVFRTLVCLGNRKKKKPHVVLAHDMGKDACSLEHGTQRCNKSFSPVLYHALIYYARKRRFL